MTFRIEHNIAQANTKDKPSCFLPGDSSVSETAASNVIERNTTLLTQMKPLIKLLLMLMLLAAPFLSQGQSRLYKKYEAAKDVEVYYMKGYKEYASRELDATLVRYEGKDRVRCRQIYTQLTNEALSLTPFHQVQNRNLIQSYWYSKGCVMIINYKVSLDQIECMLLTGNLSKTEMKDFLNELKNKNEESNN